MLKQQLYLYLLFLSLAANCHSNSDILHSNKADVSQTARQDSLAIACKFIIVDVSTIHQATGKIQSY